MLYISCNQWSMGTCVLTKGAKYVGVLGVVGLPDTVNEKTVKEGGVLFVVSTIIYSIYEQLSYHNFSVS